MSLLFTFNLFSLTVGANSTKLGIWHSWLKVIRTTTEIGYYVEVIEKIYMNELHNLTCTWSEKQKQQNGLLTLKHVEENRKKRSSSCLHY